MWYLIIIIASIIVIQQVEKRTFHWKTIVEYLWKQLYQKADIMATLIKGEQNYGGLDIANKYEKPIKIIGNLINSIIDFVNYFNQEKDEDAEEETFGYGRFNFDTILDIAKSNPDAFKKIK